MDVNDFSATASYRDFKAYMNIAKCWERARAMSACRFPVHDQTTTRGSSVEDKEDHSTDANTIDSGTEMKDATSIMVREMHMSYDLKLSCVELLIVDDFESRCTRLLKARLDNMKAFLNSGKADENRSSRIAARIRRRVFGKVPFFVLLRPPSYKVAANHSKSRRMEIETCLYE